MGTGLAVLLRNARNVSHLVVPGRNGWYMQSNETLDQSLSRAITDFIGQGAEELTALRPARSNFNRKYLAYDGIALEILEGML
jgi:hypothetical protein